MREILAALVARDLRAALVTIDASRDVITIDGMEYVWRGERQSIYAGAGGPVVALTGHVIVPMMNGLSTWEAPCVRSAVEHIERRLYEQARERIAKWRDERQRVHREGRLAKLRGEIDTAFDRLPHAPRRQSQREIGALMREYALLGGALADLGRHDL